MLLSRNWTKAGTIVEERGVVAQAEAVDLPGRGLEAVRLHSSGNRKMIASRRSARSTGRPASVPVRRRGHRSARFSTPRRPRNWTTLRSSSDDQDHDRDGRRGAQVLTLERLAVDQLDDRHRAVVRPALGQDVELVKGQQRSGDAQDEGQRERRSQQRQGDVPEACQRVAPSRAAAS